jgi:signal transduction histidine kinase
MLALIKNKLSLASINNKYVVNAQKIQENKINSKVFFKDIEKEYLIKRTQMPQKLDILFKYYQMDDLNITNDLSTIVYRSINNFVQNAVEATYENGTIVLKAELNDHEFDRPRFEISITDSGKGIPKHILKKLGSEKLSNGKEHFENNSGSGIALFHAKSDLQKHKCELLIESDLNKGTKIRILI